MHSSYNVQFLKKLFLTKTLMLILIKKDKILMNANKTNLDKQTIVLLATKARMEWMDIWFVIMLENRKNCKISGFQKMFQTDVM